MELPLLRWEPVKCHLTVQPPRPFADVMDGRFFEPGRKRAPKTGLGPRPKRGVDMKVGK